MEVVQKNNVEQKVSVIDTLNDLSKPSNEYQKRIAGAKFQVIFFKELWNRTLKICKNQFGKRPDCIQITEDIFSDALIVIFKEIEDFKLPKEVITDDEAKKIVMGWFSNIVNNRILEQRGVLKQTKVNLDSYKEFLKLDLYSGPTLHRNTEKSYDLKKVKDVWNNFCELSRDIVHLSHQYDCFPRFNHITREFEQNRKHLPKEVKKSLLEKYQTTDENYRQVKKRAFDAIFSCTNNPILTK